jgi:CubicO group peptidase (beta-lactamase class C family)
MWIHVQAVTRLGFLFGLALSALRGSHADDALSAQVDAMFAEYDRADSAGCAVGIVSHAELIYSKGFGSANLDHEVANTPQTIFEIGSFAKSFTCACMAILLDQGKISPGDDVRRYVPEMHQFDPPVRIRHMIRCRSGIWAQWHIAQLAGWYAEPTETPYTQNDLLTLLSGQKTLPFEPGSQFSYSTSDYFLMGIIVERVTGQSLAEFAKKNLFEPLGMSSTFIMEDPARIVKHRAVGYQHTKGQWHQWTQSSAGPGGRGLYTCVDDLYRWDQNFYDNRLSTGKYFTEFITEGTLLGNGNVLNATPTGTYRGVKRIQFTGGMPGYVAALTQFPDQRFTIICLCNNSTIAPWQINARIADLYLANDLEPVQKKVDQEAARRAEDKETAVDEAELRNKVGAFRLRADGRIWRIAFRNDRLLVIDHLNNAIPLIPMGRDRFQPDGGFFHETARFEFNRVLPESAFSLTSRWNGGTVTTDRVDLVEPRPEQLTDYEGQYISDELAAVYRFRVVDGKLLLRVNNLGWVPLDPTVQDEFVPGIRQNHDNRVFTFTRNEKNQISEMSAKLWRVKGVSFRKAR